MHNERPSQFGKKRAWGVLLGVAACVSLQAGCQAQRDTVNRVQPDYLDKNDLIPNQYAALTTTDMVPAQVTAKLIAKEPMFYTQNTLISKPTTTGFTGLTSYSASDKIRWEVTENSLVARQAYEFVKNAPGGTAGIGQKPQTGDVIGIFRITSHFDIRREYNTTTGEELNVVGENTSDRPWYQRRYMHVDWSQNLVTGYNSIFQYEEWTNQVRAEPIPVFVNTPNDPNAPVFEYTGEGDKRKLTYFDIVNQMVLHPETANLGGDYVNIPVCIFGEGETSCAPAEVTMRLAFRRVDPTRDYEPASLSEPLPDALGNVASVPHLNMERFGFFDVTRIGWDTVQKNVLDTQRQHFASRHNLWVHHHAQVFGAATGKLCNFDTDCGDASQACNIGDQLADSTHRGQCAALAYHHITGDIACTTDDDCRQYSDTGGVSRTASCNTAAKLCGEHMIRCSSDADCASVGARSTCDVAIGYTRADNRGLCLLPFKQRQVRQVVYHESLGFPEYMQPVTESMVSEWNSAFREAVTSARRHECELNSNIDPSTTDPSSNPCNDDKVTGLATEVGGDAQFPFVGCHSPVWGAAEGAGQRSQADVDAAHAKGWDLAACGPQGTSARLGDMRYSMIGSITDQDNQGYWGLANIASDPETGEMVVGRGAVWQTITDYYSNQVIEYVKLLTGELEPGDVIQGGDLVASMKAVGLGQTPSAAIFDAPFKNQGLDTIQGTADGIKALKMPGAGWWTPATPMFSHDYGHPGAIDKGTQRLMDGRTLGDGTNMGMSRLNSLKNTSIEARLMNRNQARLATGAAPDDNALLPATLEAASPLRGQSPQLRHALGRIKARVAAWQCGKEASFNDDLLLGFAQRLTSGAPILKSNADDAAVAFGRDWDFRAGGATDYGLMKQYAAQFIHHGVLAHEVGHSLGQRHNFTGSADAVNYPDQYWKVRAQGHPKGIRPRYEYLADPADGKYFSQQEIDGRVHEFAYSSVMDYMGLNEDAHGIGRYDHAFVKNGYVNMVEAFKTVANQNNALQYAFNTQGSGLSTQLDLSNWPTSIKGMHYSQIPAIFGTKADGTPNIGTENRYDVFLNETVATAVSGWGAPPVSNSTNDGHVLVPYRFDSDERAGLVWQDQRYDAGPDTYESLHYVGTHMLDYYFINSYARLRSGFSVPKYVSRIWGRYLDQFRQTTQLNAFDLVRWQDYFSNVPNFNQYLSDPNLFGGYMNQAAINLSADAMAAILTMPEMGSHVLTTQPDNTKTFLVDKVGAGPGAITVNVPVNYGRAFESSWRNDVGFFWYEMLDRAGAYYDKVMMLEAMTDPALYLLQRDTPTDIREFTLSFYTMFPGQMTRLFGGILAEDMNDFAPIVDTAATTANPKNPVISRPHVATMSAAPAARGRTLDAGHVTIDPQNHFTIQIWSAVLTMALFPATYDQRYMDFTRLWIDGSIEAINVPAINTVSFVDPWSHVTYRALHQGCGAAEGGATVGCSTMAHPGGGTAEAGVAARMIQHLQDIDALRLASAGNAAKAAELEQQEHQYLDLINIMRDLTKIFGHGNALLP